MESSPPSRANERHNRITLTAVNQIADFFPRLARLCQINGVGHGLPFRAVVHDAVSDAQRMAHASGGRRCKVPRPRGCRILPHDTLPFDALRPTCDTRSAKRL
jgi:hypothetical protein